MFKFLSSLIWGEDRTLSIDEAFKILEDENVELESKDSEKIGEKQEEQMIPMGKDYVALGKTGYITGTNNGNFIIDEKYDFKSESLGFKIGSKVSYNVVISDECSKVTNVTLVENDWDVVENKTSQWCHRTIICKVDDKSGRNLILNPGDIKIDLNDVASEFVPIVGDWVQLEAKCELDEGVVDLNGTILEIAKISPLRPHIQICCVSTWDQEKNIGILNNAIHFTKDALHGGYWPNRNDKVIAEIIESNQGRCALRALKIIPDFLKNKQEVFSPIPQKATEIKVDGFHLNKPKCLEFERLKETIQFSLSVQNELNHAVTVTDVIFPKSNSQCKVLSNVANISIPPNEKFEIECECTSFHMGNSKEYVLITTENFEISDWIDISVRSKPIQTYGNYQKRNQHYRHRETDDVVKGEKPYSAPRFSSFKLLEYAVPKRLLDIVVKHSNSPLDVLTNELLSMKPCLDEDLSFKNYLDKFHTSLYLEEINHVISMSVFDRDDAVFIRNNEFLMLEIENLSERRPSIMPGDKIYAKDPSGTLKTTWEGFVHKTGAKHIYIKFSSFFHDSYNGEDYEIHIVSTRGTMRKLHSAVDLAVSNLSSEILFPTRVVNREPQLKFECSLDDLNDSLMKAKGRKEKIALLLKHKRSRQNGSTDSPRLILEWYNKKLNYYQKEAVKNVLIGEARPLPYIIFGPPGTGKTVTLVECILQVLRLIPSSRLLISAPSNSAADLLAMRLIESNVLRPGDLVRYISFTHSSNLPPDLAPYSAISSTAIEGTKARSTTVLENGLVLGLTSSVAGRHRITITTCVTAGTLRSMGFPKGHFSHIFIDEAGQAMEPEIMIPLTFLDKSTGQAVLAGDPMQLGPVLMSTIASEAGLSESYVERMLNRFPYVRDTEGFPESGGYDPRLVTKLLCNYRSLPSLLKLTSSLFYNDDLIPMISDVKGESEEVAILEKLEEILGRNGMSGKLPNIVFHAIEGKAYQTPDSPSWLNPSEASQVFYYINELYRLGLSSQDVGVISPYIKQIREIRAVLNEAELEPPRMGSVEEFQGQEFNVVILSTVRSQQDFVSFDIKHGLGFISSARRMNVAISRAKTLLIIVGNPNILCLDKCWSSVISYIMENGIYIG